MDLQLTDEQRQLQEATRRVLAERLAALVDRLPEPLLADPHQVLRDAQALGWLGLGIPEQYGGAGGFDDLVLVHEELGRGLAPSLVTTLTLAGRAVLHCDATPARDELLEGLASGSVLAAPVLESDVRLTREPGKVRVEGELRQVVDADVATDLLVTAGDVVVRVPIESVELQAVDGVSDIRAWTAQLDVSVPDEAALTCTAAAEVRAEAQVLAAARALGGGRAVLARTVEHVQTRHQFDRPIGTFQAVQHQLADVATALDAAGLAVARASWAVASGQPLPEIRRAAGIAALAAAEAFADATLVAHQLHGGMGFVLDSPLHLWSARAVADPTGLRSRRHALDDLAAALGLSTDRVDLAPDHRSRDVVNGAGPAPHRG
jgi:alkylation response protein AidB-like acyl-CoA dehydrogenase